MARVRPHSQQVEHGGTGFATMQLLGQIRPLLISQQANAVLMAHSLPTLGLMNSDMHALV